MIISRIQILRLNFGAEVGGHKCFQQFLDLTNKRWRSYMSKKDSHQMSSASQGIEPPPVNADDHELILTAGQRPVALIAEFADVDRFAAAAEKARDADYTHWDAHCPMPIHGMNVHMGLRPTILPWISLVHGVVGLIVGLLMVWWINAYTANWVWTPFQGYEYLVSGKPRFSLPANIAVIFETTVLFTAFGTILGMCGLNKLPMLHNPLLNSDRFRRATSDGLFIVIEATDPLFNLNKTHDFLKSLSPLAIELVVDETPNK